MSIYQLYNIITNCLQNYGHLSRLRKYKDLEPVKWVFVLSYQRTGSTFVGRMFNDPDAVFYIFEPLDPLYSAMYGIQDGWAVPSDIFNNINGSVRYLCLLTLIFYSISYYPINRFYINKSITQKLQNLKVFRYIIDIEISIII